MAAATSMNKGKRMKKMVGSPGTWSGLVLRVLQCVFAAASVCTMVIAFGFSNNKYFWFMNTMMLLQIMWSFGLACLDIYAMRNKKDLHEWALLILLAVGDCTMLFLTLGAASISAGVATLIVGDVPALTVGCGNICRRLTKHEACGEVVLPIVLAFIASLLEAISAISSYCVAPFPRCLPSL